MNKTPNTQQLPDSLVARELLRSLAIVGRGLDPDLHGWTWRQAVSYLRFVFIFCAYSASGEADLKKYVNNAGQDFSDVSNVNWEYTELFRRAFELVAALFDDEREEGAKSVSYTTLDVWWHSGPLPPVFIGYGERDLAVFQQSGRKAPFSQPLFGQHTGEGLHEVEVLNALEHEVYCTDFWHRWYLGHISGHPLNEQLTGEVAKLPPDLWQGEEALAKVAEAIRVIEANQSEPIDRPDTVLALHRQQLLEHTSRLLAAPEMTALAAEGAADTLERAIAQYLNEAPANCLPDALAHLEDVPVLFQQIATTAKSAERRDTKAAKLAEDIEALNAKIARLEADLRDARAKTVHGLFTQSALKAAGTAFGAGLVGSLGLAVSHFFGEWPSDLTLENFRGWASDLDLAEPKLGAETLPPSYDI